MWTYEQATGILTRDGEPVATGYSGYGVGKNRPSAEHVPDVGPIPRGAYTIGDEFDSDTHGPVCMRLQPLPGTEMHGRSGFLIHGDSTAHPGAASHGCVILSRPVRLAIAQSDDRELEVI